MLTGWRRTRIPSMPAKISADPSVDPSSTTRMSAPWAAALVAVRTRSMLWASLYTGMTTKSATGGVRLPPPGASSNLFPHDGVNSFPAVPHFNPTANQPPNPAVAGGPQRPSPLRPRPLRPLACPFLRAHLGSIARARPALPLEADVRTAAPGTGSQRPAPAGGPPHTWVQFLPDAQFQLGIDEDAPERLWPLHGPADARGAVPPGGHGTTPGNRCLKAVEPTRAVAAGLPQQQLPGRFTRVLEAPAAAQARVPRLPVLAARPADLHLGPTSTTRGCAPRKPCCGTRFRTAGLPEQFRPPKAAV